MPLRSEWSLQREGFTFDTVLNILHKTAFNPSFTLPLFLLAKYTSKGQIAAAERPKSYKWLKVALALGLAGRLRDYLDKGTMNNWVVDKYDWKKDVVLVTGGSDGIGAIVVRLLAEAGLRVVVMDIQPLKFAAPPSVMYFKCDLSNPAQIRSVCDEIKDFVGHPSVIVNNAGFARGKAFLDITESDLNLTFKINTLSHYHIVQQFLPNMIKKNHGMIVTIASTAAYVTAPRIVDYAASKSAALSFHEGLAAELATTYKAPRVRTVAICPSYTDTALFKGFHKGDGFLQYMLKPETVAEAIVKAILAGRSDVVVLPRANWYIVSGLNGRPLFWQYHVRKRLAKLMAGYKGRQVEQPSEKDKVEGSGVLV